MALYYRSYYLATLYDPPAFFKDFGILAPTPCYISSSRSFKLPPIFYNILSVPCFSILIPFSILLSIEAYSSAIFDTILSGIAWLAGYSKSSDFSTEWRLTPGKSDKSLDPRF